MSLRGTDRGVGGLHLRLIGEICLYGIIEILLADGVSLCKRAVFFHIKVALKLVRLSGGEPRFFLTQLRFCLR